MKIDLSSDSEQINDFGYLIVLGHDQGGVEEEVPLHDMACNAY